MRDVREWMARFRCEGPLTEANDSNPLEATLCSIQRADGNVIEDAEAIRIRAFVLWVTWIHVAARK